MYRLPGERVSFFPSSSKISTKPGEPASSLLLLQYSTHATKYHTPITHLLPMLIQCSYPVQYTSVPREEVEVRQYEVPTKKYSVGSTNKVQSPLLLHTYSIVPPDCTRGSTKKHFLRGQRMGWIMRCVHSNRVCYRETSYP